MCDIAHAYDRYKYVFLYDRELTKLQAELPGTKKMNCRAGTGIIAYRKNSMSKITAEVRAWVDSHARDMELTRDEKIVKTTYVVRVYFSETSSETMRDKIKRMLRNEITQM
jgi:hypothetical protein